MFKICNYIEADGLTCNTRVKQKYCKRHTCYCGAGKPAFLRYCRNCTKNN